LEVLQEAQVGLQGLWRGLIHLGKQLLFDLEKCLFRRFQSSLIILLSQFDDAQVVVVDCHVYVFGEVCHRHWLAFFDRLSDLSLSALPHVYAVLIVELRSHQIILTLVVAANVGKKTALQLQGHLTAEQQGLLDQDLGLL